MSEVKSWSGFPTTANKTEQDDATNPLPGPVAHAAAAHRAEPPRAPYRLDDPRLPFTALLAIDDHGGLRSTHPFQHPRMLIGRTPDNDLALNDPNVSTRHCELAAEHGFFIVRDLGSANGTFVNERRISEARLASGDTVRLGKTQIYVTLRERRRLVKAFEGKKLWAWLCALVLAAVVLVALAMRHKGAQRDAEVQQRYETLVKGAAGKTVCPRSPGFDELRAADAAIGSRSVAIEMVGDRVRQTTKGRENNLALLELWRRKQNAYAAAAAAVQDRQQAERDQLEKISRAGARLGSTKDRKIAFWIDGLLAERLRATEPLVAGLHERELRTGDFVGLIERFVVRGDPTAAPQLANFQLGTDALALLGKCEAEQSRAASGVIGALNGLEE